MTPSHQTATTVLLFPLEKRTAMNPSSSVAIASPGVSRQPVETARTANRRRHLQTNCRIADFSKPAFFSVSPSPDRKREDEGDICLCCW
nr:hypothetical protein Iba_chr10bCG10280 [Ipomoea batatas]